MRSFIIHDDQIPGLADPDNLHSKYLLVALTICSAGAAIGYDLQG